MACISLGKIEKKMLPILLGSICCFLNRFLNNYKDSLLFKNAILTNISISSSKLFAIIPLIIIISRSKRIKDKDIQKINTRSTVEYIYIDEKAFVLKGKLFYILLSTTIFFFNQLLFVITLRVQSNTSILNILFTSIFYYLMFKIKLFKHHYLSIFFIIIIGLIIDLILDNFQKDVADNLEYLFLRILREMLYSLSSVVDKYIMENKFVSLYIMLIYHGVITLVLFIIFAIFDYYFFGIDNYEEYFSNFDIKELLVLFGVLITQFGLNLFLFMTNKDYSPCHICIIFIFGQLAYYFVEFSPIKIVVIFCLILILFFSLIFNEIILLNFWGLSYNTKGNIMKRAENDNEAITNVNTFDSFDSSIISLKDKDNKSSELSDSAVYE